MQELIFRIFNTILVFSIVSTAMIGCYYSDKKSIEESYIMPLILNRTVKVLFVGDSLAERSNTFELNSRLGSDFHIDDISKSGWDIPRWQLNLDRILEYNPDILFIGLGTNDANNYSTELFPIRYKEFFTSIKLSRPSSRIFHTLAPPTASSNLSERISINNNWLRTEYEVSELVDLFSIFEKFKSNSNIPLYPLSDPIHPNPIGYDLIGEEYKKAIVNSYR